MADRTITMGSAGKTFSVTGWKIGWAIGPAHLISAMHLFHHLAVRGTPSVLQVNMQLKCSSRIKIISWRNVNAVFLKWIAYANWVKLVDMCVVKMFFITIGLILLNPFESIRRNEYFSLKLNLLTGSASNSFWNRGKSNWKSRLLLQFAVQADGTETERTVNLPEWRWSPTYHTRGRLFHCGWHFIYRYNNYCMLVRSSHIFVLD